MDTQQNIPEEDCVHSNESHLAFYLFSVSANDPQTGRQYKVTRAFIRQTCDTHLTARQARSVPAAPSCLHCYPVQGWGFPPVP